MNWTISDYNESNTRFEGNEAPYGWNFATSSFVGRVEPTDSSVLRRYDEAMQRNENKSEEYGRVSPIRRLLSGES
jgi:hypothetical protein